MTFTFVDLFSGIGGFHQACAKLGGMCRIACDIDPKAREIYFSNYGQLPHDDIYAMAPVTNLDLVCAGFPCQSHSTLGMRKGLRDRRGKLFYRLCEFIKDSEPKAFLFENVKGILSSIDFHRTIIKPLMDLGYTVSYAVLDSRHFGLPQHRERVYIVGLRNDLAGVGGAGAAGAARGATPFDFGPLLAHDKPKLLRQVLDNPDHVDVESVRCDIFEGMELYEPPRKTASGFVLRAQRSNYTNRKLFSSDGIVGTIATGSPPPIYDEARRQIRHLTINELKKCQGFPVRFRFPPGMSRSDVVHYIGNSVSVNVIEAIVKKILLRLGLRVT